MGASASRVGDRLRGLGAAAVFACALFGCRPGSEAQSAPLSTQQLRARAELWFEAVDMYKPVAVGETEIDVYQAPMFYREHPPTEASLDGQLEFGALTLEAGALSLDVQHPTVYSVSSEVEWDGATHSQVCFLWFRQASPGPGLAAQGIRVTRDRSGFPAIVEVLEDSSERSLLFVSKSLEADAREAWGEPLAERKYSVEPNQLQGDDPLVMHLISQGSEPLGPILYQALGSSDVLDMHCRCASSRIKTIGTSVEYELRPLGTLTPDVRQALFESMGWVPAEAVPGFSAGDTVFMQLRLPPVF